jgi:anti-anti-sigma regulatory factor
LIVSVVIVLDETVTYLNVNKIKNEIISAIDTNDFVLIDARNVYHVDSAGMLMLLEILSYNKTCKVYYLDPHPSVVKILRLTGLIETLKQNKMFESYDTALGAIKQSVIDGAHECD